MYQDHVTGGVVGGHLASDDLITWRQLEPALWNDEWYDKGSVYTFSATLVDGVPTIVYPGIAWPNSTLGDCGQECFAHAVAVPANLSDPDLKDWVKPDYNPIVVNTQRDPSTAWQTSSGEWRYTYYDGDIFASDDFKVWKNVGKLFGKAECPDFFPLPSDCAGCAVDGETDRPTHVHATANYEIGTYDEGAPMTTGTWTPLKGAAGHLDGVDATFFYASKSFWDPVKSRRIMWGWVRAGLGKASGDVSNKDECTLVNGNGRYNMNSLARETNYDPLLRRLTFFPIEEYDELRGDVLATAGETWLVPGSDVDLGLPEEAGLQSELRASFDMPDEATRLGVKVITGSPLVDDAAIEIFFDFAPNANGTDVWDVAVGFASKNGDRVPDGGKSAPMALKKTDKTLDLAVWTDHTVIEAFFMAGRSFWTIPLSCDAVGNNTKQGISVYANGTAKVKSATVYAVKSIWA